MTDGGRLDAVVPVASRDLDRFRLVLWPSLQARCDAMATCFVVVPDREWRDVRDAFGPRVARCEVVPETVVVPELRTFDNAVARAGVTAMSKLGLGKPGHVRAGWYRQQLVKLAFASIAESDHYLCFDADVICVRHVEPGDLVVDGRSIIERSDAHPEWYARAAELLDVPVPTQRHGLTPAILSRAGVALLRRSIEAMPELGRPRLDRVLDALGPRSGIRDSWLLRLVWNLPWTEYALYFTNLDALGRLDDLHLVVEGGRMSGNSVWAGTDLDGYEPAASFADGATFFFSTVQSNRRIPAETVREWFAPWLT